MAKNSLRKIFASIVNKQDFAPGPMGLFVNPFYFARKGLHKHVVALAHAVRGRTLDVGCGSKPYERHFNAKEYIGIEIEGRNKDADFHYDGSIFPFGDEEFDSVVASQVLEHVFNPKEFLSEINRVLRPGGVFLITVPFVWDEHEQPYDYARYSSFGLIHLVQNHGFEIVESRKSTDDVRALFQMINTYIYKKTVTNNNLLNLLLSLVFMAPFNILGEILAAVLPRNPDLYLDNIVLARKIRNLDKTMSSGV
ncbi:MAG: class I SAM-dependent methyltransferase [Desulfomonilaceae bacterium]